MSDRESTTTPNGARSGIPGGRPESIVLRAGRRGILTVPPPPPTTFVGRRTETDMALELLRRDDVRVMTLTGPGGIGKTRLALEIASELDADFIDGIAWVPLAPVRDPELVVQSIASALNVGEMSGHTLLDQIILTLERQQILLVLDNFEQVLDAATYLADIVRACPRVTLLVTSRSPLHLSGEHVVPVPPLTLPSEADQPLPDLLRDFEAVRLFVDRAVSVLPSFEFNLNTAPHVLHICQRLDGLPLAIELAAARVYHLSVETLHDRLTHRLPLLTGGRRDLPVRQRALRETIAWSYELLSPGEQKLFRQLAVFAGGFTLEAAETVSDDLRATLDHLTALVDKSLVQHQPDTAAGSRYALLETIQEYAAEQLKASGDEDAIRERHAAFFLRLARQAEPELNRGDRRVWAERLDAEHDNLRQALEWLAESRRWCECLQLASALGDFWDTRGYLSEGRAWLERALIETDGDDGPDAASLRALAATRLALILVRQGSLDEAEAHLNVALQVWRDEDDAARLALTLCVLGGVAEYRGDDPRAQLLYERGLVLFREVDHRAGMAIVLNNLADTAYRIGDLDWASTLAEEAVAIADEGGLDVIRASALFTIAEVAFANGRYQDALSALRDGAETSHIAGYRLGLADALAGFAAIAATNGDGERAARLLGAVETVTQELGVRRIPHQTFRRSALAATQTVLDETAFTSAWTSGRELSLAEAMAETEKVQTLPVELLSQLTPRERDVLRHLVAGRTDRAIGEELFISTRTVESHVANIFVKLGVHSRSAAAAAVAAAGLGDVNLPPSEEKAEN